MEQVRGQHGGWGRETSRWGSRHMALFPVLNTEKEGSAEVVRGPWAGDLWAPGGWELGIGNVLSFEEKVAV